MMVLSKLKMSRKTRMTLNKNFKLIASVLIIVVIFLAAFIPNIVMFEPLAVPFTSLATLCTDYNTTQNNVTQNHTAAIVNLYITNTLPGKLSIFHIGNIDEKPLTLLENRSYPIVISSDAVENIQFRIEDLNKTKVYMLTSIGALPQQIYCHNSYSYSYTKIDYK